MFVVLILHCMYQMATINGGKSNFDEEMLTLNESIWKLVYTNTVHIFAVYEA